MMPELETGFNLALAQYAVLLAPGITLAFVLLEDALEGTELEKQIGPVSTTRPGLILVPSDNTASSSELRIIRNLIGDVQEPYYFTNQRLTDFYYLEGQDITQAAALACETWAGEIAYNEGQFSSGGLQINAVAMAGEKRQRASELRMSFRRG